MSAQTTAAPPRPLLVPVAAVWLQMPYLARDRWARRARRWLPEVPDLITPDDVRHAVLVAQGWAKPAPTPSTRPEATQARAHRGRPRSAVPVIDAAALERFEAWAAARTRRSSRRQVDVDLTPSERAAGWTLAGLHGAHGLWRDGDRDDLVVAGHRMYERRRKERLAARSALQPRA